jgi:solute carrier family 35 protein F5
MNSFVGVLLVSLSDSVQSKNPASQTPPAGPSPTAAVLEHVSQPLLGDFLALISALFYALYVILLKVRIKNEDRIDMQLFFGFVGLFNVLACWPMGFVLHWTGVEVFELPTKAAEWYAIVINVSPCKLFYRMRGDSYFGQMVITWSSDYLYVLAMLKTTPLVVTVGISLTIPVAVLGDFILNTPVHAQVMIGAALVLVGFVAIGSDNS